MRATLCARPAILPVVTRLGFQNPVSQFSGGLAVDAHSYDRDVLLTLALSVLHDMFS